MLNGTMHNSNFNPENSYVAKHKSVDIDAIHSQDFLFGEFNMSGFQWLIGQPCECLWECGEYAKPGNRFVNYHGNRGRKFLQLSGDLNVSKRPEVQKRRENKMEITIDIAGTTGEGKSTIAAVLGKAIQDLGFSIHLQDDDTITSIFKKLQQFKNDETFRKRMIENSGTIKIKTTPKLRSKK